MIVSVNNLQLLDNEAMVTYFGQVRAYNQRGRAQVVRRQMRVEGEMLGANTAALNTRLGQILAALSVDGFSVQLLTSAGAPTYMQVGGAESFTGGRLVESHFPMEDGKAHFATGLPFGFTVEADSLVSDLDPLVSFEERVTIIGNGGGRRVTLEVDSGSPVEQIVSTYTPVIVLQTGTAVGSVAWPESYVSPPLYPSQLENAEQAISYGSPRRDGAAFLDWPVSWNYRMTLPTYAGIPRPNYF